MPASREAEGHGPGCRPQIGRDPSWAGGSEAQNRFCSLPASRLFAQSDRLEGSKEPAGGGRGGREAHPPTSREVGSHWGSGQGTRGAGASRGTEVLSRRCSETPSSRGPSPEGWGALSLTQPCLSPPLPLSGRLGGPAGVQGAQRPLVPGGTGQLGPGLRPAQLLWRLHPHHRCDRLDPAGADLRSCPLWSWGPPPGRREPRAPLGGEQAFWGGRALWKQQVASSPPA